MGMKKLIKEFRSNPRKVWRDGINDIITKRKHYTVSTQEAIQFLEEKLKELKH